MIIWKLFKLLIFEVYKILIKEFKKYDKGNVMGIIYDVINENEKKTFFL